ncbi:MAG: hypothetical protein ACYC7J_18515 [Syntrophales bacterium]
MAKVLITITDEEKDGDVHVEIESDPPFPMKEEESLTTAQRCGLMFLELLVSKKK